jgi:hypothetical protein
MGFSWDSGQHLMGFNHGNFMGFFMVISWDLRGIKNTGKYLDFDGIAYETPGKIVVLVVLFDVYRISGTVLTMVFNI